MKGFVPHNMYDKKKANTHKEHVELKKKGYSHSPLNCWDTHKKVGMKKSPSGRKNKDGSTKMVNDCEER